MRRRYVNARDVFPEELLLTMSEAMGGQAAHFYLPGYAYLIRGKRVKTVMKLRDQGYSVQQIAERLQVCERTVWRMLKKVRNARGSDGENHETS